MKIRGGKPWSGFRNEGMAGIIREQRAPGGLPTGYPLDDANLGRINSFSEHEALIKQRGLYVEARKGEGRDIAERNRNQLARQQFATKKKVLAEGLAQAQSLLAQKKLPVKKRRRESLGSVRVLTPHPLCV